MKTSALGRRDVKTLAGGTVVAEPARAAIALAVAAPWRRGSGDSNHPRSSSPW